MSNFLKVLLGLGAAAATAGIIYTLTKKEEPDFECDFDECEDCDCTCEDCTCECDECECDCDECDREECDCDCEDCDCCDFCDESVRTTAADVVNGVIDTLMGGFIVAADTVSELLTKAADKVSDKLEERLGADDADFSYDFECDCECDDLDCVECCDCEASDCCECEGACECEEAPVEEAPTEE